LEANEPVKITMDTNEIKLDSHGSLYKANCIIVVRGNMPYKNGISIEDTYSQSASVREHETVPSGAERHACISI
jgi:hypothetical protein